MAAVRLIIGSQLRGKIVFVHDLTFMKQTD